jgi:hypothetical protein
MFSNIRIILPNRIENRWLYVKDRKAGGNISYGYPTGYTAILHILIWDVFDYIFEADRRRMGRIKPIRTYRNPVFLAWEWKRMLESGEYTS